MPPLSCGKAKYIVVLLHGVGSSAGEIIDLSLDWAPTLNKAEFLAPELPWPRHADKVNSPGLSPGEESMVDGLQRYLEATLPAKRLKNEQVALVGFAEGAALAIAAGMRQTDPVGAVVAIGRGLNQFPQNIGEPNSKPPLLLVSANIGPEFPAVGWHAAEKWLQGVGIQAERLDSPGDYFGLDDHGVIQVAEYLHTRIVKPNST